MVLPPPETFCVCLVVQATKDLLLGPSVLGKGSLKAEPNYFSSLNIFERFCTVLAFKLFLFLVLL